MLYAGAGAHDAPLCRYSSTMDEHRRSPLCGASAAIAYEVRRVDRPDVVAFLRVLNAADDAHRGHDDHRKPDNRSEDEDDDARPPCLHEQFLHQPLARLTAERADRAEPTRRK